MPINLVKIKMVLLPRKDLKELTEITLFGKELQLSTDWIYLRQWFDMESTAAECNGKGVQDFLYLHSTFGKLWGVKPKSMHLIYTVIERPIIVTCGALVRWPRTKLQAGRTKLSKLQRLNSLGITGATSSLVLQQLQMKYSLGTSTACYD